MQAFCIRTLTARTSLATDAALALKDAHSVCEFTQATPFQYSFAWQVRPMAAQAAPFQYCPVPHWSEPIVGLLATHPPFFPRTSPVGQVHGLFLQTGRRKSVSTGSLGTTSLQGPSLQTGRRRSDSGDLGCLSLSCSFSLAAGASARREEGAIFSSLPIFGSGEMRSGVASDGRASDG